MTSQDSGDENLPNFNPEFCRKVCWAAAIVCLALTLCGVILFAAVNPSKCPGWNVPRPDGTYFLVWPYILGGGFWSLWVTYNAIRWKKFALRVIEGIRRAQRTLLTRNDWDAMPAVLLDFTWVFIMGMAGSVLFAAMPLMVMAIHCS